MTASARFARVVAPTRSSVEISSRVARIALAALFDAFVATFARVNMSSVFTPSRSSRSARERARSVVIPALIGLLALTGARAESDDEPLAEPTVARILAHKTLSPSLAVEGMNLTVTVALTNAGGSEARKVRARDDGFSSEAFELLTGKESLSATYASVMPGETVKYSFTVVPKTSGSYKAGAASVSYQGASGRETTHGTSNVVGDVLVYTKVQRKIFTAIEVGRYLTLGACKTMEDWVRYGTLFGSVAGALLLNWFALKVKKGVAAARRRMAVAALERGEKKSS